MGNLKVFDNKRILILGASGFLGRHLFRTLGSERAVATFNNSPILGGVHFDSLSMGMLDILEAPEAFSHAVILLGDTKPDNCALDIAKSRALNVDSIKNILYDLQRWNIKPMFTSTEVIFDGIKGNYVESDEVNPILTYGKQKVEIERFMQDQFEDYLIIRPALIYGSERADGTILSTWLDSIEKGEVSHCAYDYVCSPIHIDDVVAAIINLVEIEANGIYHLAGHSAYSRLELYNILLGQVNQIYPVDLEPISCSMHDFNLMEKRPLNVSMKPDKLVSATGLVIKDVKDACGLLAEDAFRGGVNG